MYKSARWLVLFVLLATAIPLEAQTVTFRQGVGGYTGTQDTEINSTVTTPMGSNTQIIFDEDRDGVVRALVRFDNIFGTGAGQIPLGSNITAATLRVYVTEGTLDNGVFEFYRMITDWNQATAVWTTFGAGGPQPGGAAVSPMDASHAPFPDPADPANAPDPIDTNVATSLRAWSGGFANRGWLIKSATGDGGIMLSSEHANVNWRPLLTVTYAPIPEPSVLALAGLGLGTLGVARYRRWRAKPSAA
jgi:hypothetical protein